VVVGLPMLIQSTILVLMDKYLALNGLILVMEEVFTFLHGIVQHRCDQVRYYLYSKIICMVKQLSVTINVSYSVKTFRLS